MPLLVSQRMEQPCQDCKPLVVQMTRRRFYDVRNSNLYTKLTFRPIPGIGRLGGVVRGSELCRLRSFPRRPCVPGGAEGIEDQGIQAQLLGAPDNLMPVVDRRIAGGSLELRTLHPLPCFAGGCRAVFVAVKNRHRYPPELGISESGRESADVAKTIHDVAARGVIGGNQGAHEPEKGGHE